MEFRNLGILILAGRPPVAQISSEPLDLLATFCGQIVNLLKLVFGDMLTIQGTI